MSYQMSGQRTIEGSGKVQWWFWFWRWWKNWCRQRTKCTIVQDSRYWIVITTIYKMQSLNLLSMTTLHLNRRGNEKYEFLNFTVVKYVRFPLVVQVHLNFLKAMFIVFHFNPLNPELNPICYLLALLAHHFLHVSRIMVKSLTLRLLMSYIYIYGAHILDVSRSHTMTQHSR